MPDPLDRARRGPDRVIPRLRVIDRGDDNARRRAGRGTASPHCPVLQSSARVPGESMMKESRKPNTTRIPPEPSKSHAEIDDWMRRVMPDLHPIVKELDELIRKTIDGLHYAVKWKKAYYGHPDLGWVIEMVAYDVSVNVVFLGGADFDTPPPLGTTDRSRYIKVKTLEEARQPEMRRWIEEAGKVRGWQ